MRFDKVLRCLKCDGIYTGFGCDLASIRALVLPPEVSGDPVEYRRYSRARGWRIGPGRCK